MTLHQLDIFAAVARLKSFSEAARRLFISHSAACRAVKALENELGVTLIIRRENRVLGLTKAGETLLEETGKIKAAVDACETRVRAAGKEE